MSTSPLRAACIGVLAAIGTAAILGVPSDVIPNPWFTREIGVDGFDVFVLVALSLLTGALAVTYAAASGPPAAAQSAGIGSGVLGFFAISCPVCNKIVLALAGASGASGWFAAVQPLLGAVALALAATALTLRVRAIRRGTCPAPSPALPARPSVD